MKFQDKLKKLFDYQKFEGDPKLNQTIKDSLRVNSDLAMDNYLSNLNENELGRVAGGVQPDDLEREPTGYQYKAEVKYAGYFAKALPSDDADNVCALPINTTVYVMEVIDGTRYVKCLFAGAKKRQEGFIREDILNIVS